MKKFLAVLVVLALVGISSIALAEVTVDGSVSLRSRNFSDLDNDDTTKSNADDQVDTQEKVIINISAKSEKVKGKISLWNDFEPWGGLETQNGGSLGFREAW